ncbi:MAG: GNAT family N-acetyltransferase [Anaerolineae bacterium]|nr:GNAT family N-acetyltransferase [Anaerolineae bacterium]
MVYQRVDSAWRVSTITDKNALRAFLNRDRGLSVYALGDLDEPYWSRSEFIGAEMGGELRGVALFYSGFFAQPILVFCGSPEALVATRGVILERGDVYYILEPALHAIIEKWYARRETAAMWRMVVSAGGFRPYNAIMTERLGPADAAAMSNLEIPLSEAGTAALLAQGVFYAVRDQASGEIVAQAGTHVISKQESAAAVGHVYTAPAHRGKGYATACTAAVTQALLDMGIQTIGLNVDQHNAAAIKVYRRLGYETHCPLIEGLGEPV